MTLKKIKSNPLKYYQRNPLKMNRRKKNLKLGIRLQFYIRNRFKNEWDPKTSSSKN